jgi:hypothetical protein
MNAPKYTYRTDAVHCDTEYPTVQAALDAAVTDREWAAIGSQREARDIAAGAWLRIYDSDGVTVVMRSAGVPS